MKNTQSGRSMIEMICVLAIIGVLSVGAIAGYNEIMDRYKRTRHLAAANELFYVFSSLKRGGFTGLYPYNVPMKKLNLLPYGIEYASGVFLRDIWYGKNIRAYQLENSRFLAFSFIPNTNEADICRNVLMLAKAHSDELKRVTVDVAPNYGVIFDIFVGDAFCTGTRQCIRDISITQIEDICNFCEGDDCFVACKGGNCYQNSEGPAVTVRWPYS